MSHAGNPVVMSCLMPHPPIVVPAVGKGREQEACDTVKAMASLAKRIVARQPDVLVLISPHSPRKPGSFGIWESPQIEGSMERFNAPEEMLTLPNDRGFVAALGTMCRESGIKTFLIENEDLDHGAYVPLYYLVRAGWDGPTVVTSLNYPGDGQLEEFGKAIRDTAKRLGKKTIVLASGDMSHRLQPHAPGGYHPRAADFDVAFVDTVRRGELRRVRAIDRELIAVAGEDVVDSSVVAISASDFDNTEHEVLSYEGPFGVGYSIAVFSDRGASQGDSNSDDETTENFLPRLARSSVETYLLTRQPMKAPVKVPEEFAHKRAGAFVTIWSYPDERLRGCIGTIQPTQRNIVEEVIDRAIMAATKDPRFESVRIDEVENLRFDVSVLHEPEPVDSLSDLDPAEFGVIVTDDFGRRGVMLPGVEGLNTAEEQVQATRQKARIPEKTDIFLQRVRVDNYSDRTNRIP